MQDDMGVLVVDSIDDLPTPRLLVPVKLRKFHADVICQNDLQLLHQLVDQLVQGEEGVGIGACTFRVYNLVSVRPNMMRAPTTLLL